MAETLAERHLERLRYLRELQAQKLRHDIEAAKSVDVFAALGWWPICKPFIEGAPERCGQCPQEQFFAATELDVLYGGAAGGGKSAALIVYAIQACVRHPGLRVLFVRRTFDELAESIFPKLAAFDFAAKLGGHWNGTDHQLTFDNRSVIRFRYVERLLDASRRQGGEYQLLCVDERTLIAPGAVDILEKERLRSASPDLPVIGLRCTSNPGEVSHSEVKERYVKATDNGRKVVVDQHGQTRRFIPAKATDNPFLDADYYRKLDAIPDPQRRAAMRDGSWDLFAGQVFTEWRYDRHVVDEFTLPDIWRKYAGIDHGYANPWAVIWAAIDNDDRAWIYREIYESGVGEVDQAQRIFLAESTPAEVMAGKVRGDLSREWGVTRFADPSMWAHKAGPSVAEAYIANNVNIIPANNDRSQGWSRLHHWLGDMPACDLHRRQGWITCPRLHVFSNCVDLIRELPAMVYRRVGDVEDAEKRDDHSVDALRYLLMGVSGTPSAIDVGAWSPPKDRYDYDLRARRSEDASVLTADW